MRSYAKVGAFPTPRPLIGGQEGTFHQEPAISFTKMAISPANTPNIPEGGQFLLKCCPDFPLERSVWSPRGELYRFSRKYGQMLDR